MYETRPSVTIKFQGKKDRVAISFLKQWWSGQRPRPKVWGHMYGGKVRRIRSIGRDFCKIIRDNKHVREPFCAFRYLEIEGGENGR